MTTRLLLLNGLAILAVVINHATAWGNIAMFWWTDRYQPVAVPNYDQLYSMADYALATLKQLTVFSVPAFLFTSGFFIAYAAKGKRSSLNARTIRTRVQNLLIPYLIWSILIFVGDWLQGIRYSLSHYGAAILLGQATPAYFFVPLLCQFYLLAPWLVSWAKTRWRILLFLAACLQLGTVLLGYGCLFMGETLGAGLWSRLALVRSSWLFAPWAFFFVLGVVCSLHTEPFLRWLGQHRRGLLGAMFLLGFLNVAESLSVRNLTGNDWFGVNTLSANLYSVGFTLCFVAFVEEIPVHPAQWLCDVGRRSYGIYLMHPKALEFAARLLRKFMPWVLSQQWLFQPVLIFFAIGAPWVVMRMVAQSPVRRAYRHLFG